MVLSRQTRQQIEKQDFDGVEMDWLDKIDEGVDDIGHFTGIARALVGAGERERAKMLLDLLDDQLQAGSLWQQRLVLLKKGGEIQYSTSKLLAVILQTLHEIHADAASLDQLIETVGLGRSSYDATKTWDRVLRLESLVRFDEGVVVYVMGKGVGRVVEVNQQLESFKIAIDGKGDLRVGFRAAAKMLQALPADHILARKVVDPESLSAMKPADLLKEILASFDRPLTAAEVRDALLGLVPANKWNSWWTTARKHPQIVASPDLRNAYTFAESSKDARGAILQRFDAATTRGKLDLLRRQGSGDEKLLQRMVGALQRLGEEAQRIDPGLCFEIWYQLERIGVAPKPEGANTTGLIESSKSPQLLAGTIEGRPARERAYAIVRETRDDWVSQYQQALLDESDTKLIVYLSEFLITSAPDIYRKTLERCLAQPTRAPALFVWIAVQAADNEQLEAYRGIRLFKKILGALTAEGFSSYRTQLRKLCDSGNTLPKLLPLFDEDDAREAEAALKRASALGRDQREPLLNALHLRFPSMREQDELPLYALEASVMAKRAELKKIVEVDIPTNRKAIQVAREMGDLRENFEYKAARQRHEFLTALATGLNQDLSRSQMLDLSEVGTSEVRVGTVVGLLAGDHEERLMTILGPWESSPETGIVSYESDVAKRLIGKQLGDEVEIGDKVFEIKSIRVADL